MTDHDDGFSVRSGRNGQHGEQFLLCCSIQVVEWFVEKEEIPVRVEVFCQESFLPFSATRGVPRQLEFLPAEKALDGVRKAGTRLIKRCDVTKGQREVKRLVLQLRQISDVIKTHPQGSVLWTNLSGQDPLES